ncbi:RNA polymerase sigma factor [Chitinophaga sp. sic0106]|uniref:RNA polymerase sigma factor n=1 Tax=Chitinophaga sp. sic0106 TaxID=2854785 RepID=UPI001C473D45|nr:hypothetical protein [Chitinophaga sp. sic0106]MBV7529051.1 hypothetical protein [Chitinophaga sp. sic0106]
MEALALMNSDTKGHAALSTEGGGIVYTPQEERLFNEIVLKRRSLMYYIIHSKKWIKEHEKDDYYQEAVIYLWQHFHQIVREHRNYPLEAWVARNTRWALWHHKKRNFKHDTRNEYRDDLIGEDMEDIPHDEGRYLSLYKAIDDLPHDSWKEVVRLVMSGCNLAAIERQQNGPRRLQGTMTRVRQYIRKNGGKYFDDIDVLLQQRASVLANRKVVISNGRAIEMRSMDGVLIKTYDTISDTDGDGFNSAAVGLVCRGQKVHHRGYRWNYVGETDPAVLCKTKSRPVINTKKVLQFDLSGNYIKTWDSVNATESDGFVPYSVRFCVIGRTKSHRGFVFKYADEGPAEEFVVQETEAGVLVREWSIKDLQQSDFDVEGVRRCIRGRSKTHAGFVWRRAS